MRAINLLPKEEGQGRKAPPLPVLVGCLGAVLVATGLSMLYLSASGSVQREQRALAAAQAQTAAIPPPHAPSPLTSQVPAERTARVAALASALSTRVDWDRLLREISEVVPSDVQLLSINAQAPSIVPPPPAGAVGTNPQGIILLGCTFSQDSVARFLSRLDVVPDLTAITLGDSTQPTDAATSVDSCPNGMVAFKIVGALQPEGAAS